MAKTWQPAPYSEYAYPNDFNQETRISYVSDFAKWLAREVSSKECNSFSTSGWRLANINQYKNLLQDCANKYYPEYVRERASEYKRERKGECQDIEKKVTNDFFNVFGQRGKEHFCSAATEYFARQHKNDPEWGY